MGGSPLPLPLPPYPGWAARLKRRCSRGCCRNPTLTPNPDPNPNPNPNLNPKPFSYPYPCVPLTLTLTPNPTLTPKPPIPDRTLRPTLLPLPRTRTQTPTVTVTLTLNLPRLTTVSSPWPVRRARPRCARLSSAYFTYTGGASHLTSWRANPNKPNDTVPLP